MISKTKNTSVCLSALTKSCRRLAQTCVRVQKMKVPITNRICRMLKSHATGREVLQHRSKNAGCISNSGMCDVSEGRGNDRNFG